MRHVDAGPAGLVFNVQRYSIHDGPGIRTTLFLKGCPLGCIWCCNPESQRQGPEIGVYPSNCIGCGSCAAICPLGAIEVGPGGVAIDRARCDGCGSCAEACVAGGVQQMGRWRSVAGLMEEVERDRLFYRLSGGGVTLSGGEPTMQPEFALALLRVCKERGLHTALETCGHTAWDVLASLLPHLDLVLYDLKQIDPNRHRQLTGLSNELILTNARRVVESGVEMVTRAPIIPGCNDDEGSIRALVQFVRGLECVRELHLLPYHRLGVGKHSSLGTEPPFDAIETVSGERLDWAVALAAENGLKAQVGG